MDKSQELKQLNALNWAYTLGEADLTWVNNSLVDIKDKIKGIKEEAAKQGVHPQSFHNLEKYLEMLMYVMENRHAFWEDEKEESKKAIDALGEPK